MRWVSFHFGRPAHVTFYQNPTPKPPKGHGRGEEERLAGNNFLRLSDIRNDLFPDVRKLLELCPVKNESFEDFSVKDTNSTLTYFYYPTANNNMTSPDALYKIKDMFIFSQYNIKKSSNARVGSSGDEGGWIII